MKDLFISLIFALSVGGVYAENLASFMEAPKKDLVSSSLSKVFNEAELRTIDQIVEYYDDFIVSKTSGKMPIEKAYEYLLDEKCPVIRQSNNWSELQPKIGNRIKFFRSLDRASLSEIFDIRDTLTFFFLGTKEKVVKPFSFSLNLKGKYMDFLKEMSKRNDFYYVYYNDIQNSGDICPSNYYAIAREYKKMDFSQKDERLILIINLLHFHTFT